MKNIKMSELKRGQIVYECERGVNVQLRITKGSHRIENKEGSYDGWRACARTVNGNAFVSLFQADGGAYGPHLYSEPAYIGKTL